MSKFEIGMIVFIFILFLSIAWAVLGTAMHDVKDNIKDNQSVSMSLPECCQHLYNVGRSSEWADCMGVGYVN